MEVSSLGLGTYLGRADAAGDEGYGRAALAFWAAGGNAFDTAANYRQGRSERALGRVLPGLPRDQVFVSTKAGYLPMGDGVTSESPRDWFERVLGRTGLLDPADVVEGCHALTPRYLAHQLELSLAALGLDHVDLFHLHNPEQQRPALGPGAFRDVLRRAFGACEALVAAGKARAYGCATWNGFRVPPEAPDHLSLEEVLDLATQEGGRDHHLRWLQLPLNLALPEAWLTPTQVFGGERMPLLQAARHAGLRVQVSAPLLQARLLPQLPAELVSALGADTPAQAALQFARSAPGVTTALCGMGNPAHVAENAPVLGLPRIPEADLWRLLAP